MRKNHTADYLFWREYQTYSDVVATSLETIELPCGIQISAALSEMMAGRATMVLVTVDKLEETVVVVVMTLPLLL